MVTTFECCTACSTAGVFKRTGQRSLVNQSGNNFKCYTACSAEDVTERMRQRSLVNQTSGDNLLNVALHVERQMEEEAELGKHTQSIAGRVCLVLTSQHLLKQPVCARLGLWKNDMRHNVIQIIRVTCEMTPK